MCNNGFGNSCGLPVLPGIMLNNVLRSWCKPAISETDCLHEAEMRIVFVVAVIMTWCWNVWAPVG